MNPTSLPPARRFGEADSPRSQNLVAFEFHSDRLAADFAGDVARLHRSGRVEVHDAVFVTKDGDGVTVVSDRVAQTPVGEAALQGSGWGVLAGILIGGPVIGLVVGAGLGVLQAALIDRGVDRQFIQEIRDAVRPGCTVVIMLVSHVDLEAGVALLDSYPDAELVSSNLSAGDGGATASSSVRPSGRRLEAARIG